MRNSTQFEICLRSILSTPKWSGLLGEQKKSSGCFDRWIFFHTPKALRIMWPSNWKGEWTCMTRMVFLWSSKWCQWLEGSASFGWKISADFFVVGLRQASALKLLPSFASAWWIKLGFMIGWGPWHKDPYVYLKPSHGLVHSPKQDQRSNQNKGH